MSRILASTRTRAKLVFIPLLAVAVAAAFLVTVPFGGAPNRTAQAMAFLNGIPDQVAAKPGQVIYEKIDNYVRYGPKAPQLASLTGVPSEENTAEMWEEIGPTGTSGTRVFARTLDASGNIVSQSILKPPSTNQTVSLPSGAVVVDTTYMPAPLIVDPQYAPRFIQPLIQQGTGHIISQTSSELVFEWKEAVPDRDRNVGPNDLRTPYEADLKPQFWLYRMTVRSDGVVLLNEKYVITESGAQVLTSRSQVQELQVLDQFPANLP